MTTTSKQFEGIVEMLNNFRSEIQIFSSLGLLNINKHSENFMQRVLNLSYGYELDNLNKEKYNFPGLDLGDTGDGGVAFQITSTKKLDKIEDTLNMCLKHKHYETFKIINIFILTTKQTSYSIKVITEPHFSFSPDKNIKDFSDLLKDIEHLPPSRMEALHDYIKSELKPTLETIKNGATQSKRSLLDIAAGIAKCGMPSFYLWRSQVSIKNGNIIVPEIYTKLNAFLSSPALKIHLLPMLNPALQKTNSNKEILYLNDMIGTGISNQFYAHALLIQNSSIISEIVNYTDSNNEILTNLFAEMKMVLTKILFFSSIMENNQEIEVSFFLDSNKKVIFHPVNSLVVRNVFNTYILEKPFEFKVTLIDTKTSTLFDLLQKIMYAFVAHEPSFMSIAPFINIDQDSTEFVINEIKKSLGVI